MEIENFYKKVKNNFSKAARTYDKYAVVQQYAAEVLAKNIRSLYTTKTNQEPLTYNPSLILEVGCGTGIFTKNIIELYPNAKLICTDISPEMLKQCKKSIKSFREKFQGKIFFIATNIEIFIPASKYDLITANLTFQWFKYPEKTFLMFEKHLTKNGWLAFTITAKPTFKTLKDIFSKYNIYFQQIHMPDRNEIEKICSPFKIISFKEYSFKEYFPNIRDCLKSIGQRGTRVPWQMIPVRILRNIIKEEQKNNRPFQADYTLFSVICKKK